MPTSVLTPTLQLVSHALDTFRMVVFVHEPLRIMQGLESWAVEDLIERHAEWAENLEDPSKQPAFGVWLGQDFSRRNFRLDTESAVPRFLFRMRAYELMWLDIPQTRGFLIRPCSGQYLKAPPGDLWAIALLVE